MILNGLDHGVGTVMSSNTILKRAAMTDLRASLRRKDIMRSGPCLPVGQASGVTCPVSCSCDVGDNLHKQVTVSSLFSEVTPMFSAHSEGSRFAESWHSLECVWDELGNLGQEEV